MTAGVEQAYSLAQERLVATGRRVSIAPVGTLWFRATQDFPDVELYDEDGHHASPAGSHLAALTLAASLAPHEAIAATRYVPPDVDPATASKLRQTLES